MIVATFFGLLALAAVLYATGVAHVRKAILSLWVASLCVGGVYLTLGAELLAILQWVISTLVAMSLIFFSTLFGEYSDPGEAERERSTVLKTGLSWLMGVGFVWMVHLSGVGDIGPIEYRPVEGTDVLALGKALLGQHLLALEILALTLFLVLVGSGVIARPMTRKPSEVTE